MSAIPASMDRFAFLRRTLFVDAATCLAMALFLLVLAQPLAPLLGLPALLLEVAGLALLPIAAFIAWVATRTSLTSFVIAGNLAWVAGSMVLLVWAAPTPLGYAFVIVQGAVVTLLAALEWTGLHRTAG